MLKEIGENIWTIDGPDVVFAGAAMHTRMTVVRLTGGGLWVHSPIKLSADIQTFIESLSDEVVALVAPNKFHHLFVAEWIQTFPDAKVFAETQVKQKVSLLADAEELTDQASALYSSDIEQVIFSGNLMFQEAVFFHKHSRTLILTDLMINLKTDKVKFWPKLFLKFEGVTFPNGGIPRLYRWFTRDRVQARKALTVIQQWAPTQITFCHGEPFKESADEVIQEQFDWLLK